MLNNKKINKRRLKSFLILLIKIHKLDYMFGFG